MKIKNQKCGFYLIFCLVSVFFISTCALAQGPSFDCDKAESKIEKCICNDLNLSVADQGLSDYYSELLEGLGQTEKRKLKDEQQAWLKNRNQECTIKNKREMIDCLNFFYKNRLDKLTPQIESLHKKRAKNDKAIRKYPPYPNIWLRKTPDDSINNASLHFFQQKDGDILIVYINGLKQVNNNSSTIIMYGAFTFFEFLSPHKVELNDYLGKYRKISTPTEITLKDGTKIASKAIDIRASKPCPITLDMYLSIQTPDGKTIEKMPVYIREKPQKRPIGERCVDELNRSYIDKVISLAGRFVHLEDDTFLIYNSIEPTIILRLNKEKLMKFESYDDNRIFWIDPALAKTTDNYQKLQDKIVEMKPIKK